MIDSNYIGIELFTIWAAQLILYILKTTGNPILRTKNIWVFFICTLVFFISPFFYKVDGGYNPETRKYICGLAALIPYSMFWILGIFGNLILLTIFYFVDRSGIKEKTIQATNTYP